MTTFQTRTISATVFSVVMLTGLFWNTTSFQVLFGLITAGCLWELWQLTFDKNTLHRVIQTLGVVLGVGTYAMIAQEAAATPLTSGWQSAGFPANVLGTLSVTASLSTFVLLIVELFSKSEKPFQNVAFFNVGFFYIVAPFAVLSALAPKVVAGMLFLTWANDSFAYIIGSRIGKTPFFPRISPKKTWEGTLGGALMCLATAGVIAQFFRELVLVDWLAVGALVAVFGTLGDLVESMLKRSVGVKDSGNIMPGHGGFLDRFDAFVFVIPFVFLYLFILRGSQVLP